MIAKHYEMDMCRGPIGITLLKFILPLLLSNALQRCFLLADLVVIGQFADFRSLAAVGSVGHVTVLFIDLFIGIAIGTGVVAAHSYGAGDRRRFARTVQTSVVAAWWAGVALMVLGMALTHPILKLLNTPDEIFCRAVSYQMIILVGIPAQLLTTVGCALLGSVGDTRRPLVIMTVSGVLNVVLNLVLVAVFRMDVVGVAVATVLSEAVSVLLLYRLMRDPGEICHFRFRKSGFDWAIFRETQKIGVPAGAQGICFAVSNLAIQTAVNGFGSVAIAGNTAAASLEGFLYVALAAFASATVSFVAQNYGGGQYHRIRSGIRWCCIGCIVTGVLFCGAFLAAGPRLMAFFNPDPAVIEWGMMRFRVVCMAYVLCGLMDVSGAGLRGFGYSLTPALSALVGTCVFRLWWVWEIFPRWRSLDGLLFSYPISWVLTGSFNFALLFFVSRKLFRAKVRKRHVVIARRAGA